MIQRVIPTRKRMSPKPKPTKKLDAETQTDASTSVVKNYINLFNWQSFLHNINLSMEVLCTYYNCNFLYLVYIVIYS